MVQPFWHTLNKHHTQKKVTENFPVGGRLHCFKQRLTSAFRQSLDSFRHPRRLQDSLSHNAPPTTHRSFPTIAYTHEQRRLLLKEMADLLMKKAIEPALPTRGFSSSMFVIPNKSGFIVQCPTFERSSNSL